MLMKAGTCVATPAFPVPGVVVQQWMWDAIVGETRFANDTEINNVFATVSMTTRADPVPGEPVGGISEKPLKVVWYVITLAFAAGASNSANAAVARKRFIVRSPTKS
jgi:hypothetical protein